MASIDLGSLEYSVIAKLDAAEAELQAFETKWQNHVLTWTLTLDTSAAEAQLAAITGQTGGGRVIGGGEFDRNAGRNMAKFEQAETAAADEEEALASTGVGASAAQAAAGGGTGGGRRGGMRMLRAFMLARIDERIIEGIVENQESLNDIEDVAANDGSIEGLKRTIKDEKSIDSGVSGFLRRAMVGGERAVGLDSLAYDSDVHGELLDNEKRLKREQEQDKALKTEQRLKQLFGHEDESIEGMENEADEIGTTDSPAKAFKKINDAYAKQLHVINDAADKAEAEARAIEHTDPKAAHALIDEAEDMRTRGEKAARDLQVAREESEDRRQRVDYIQHDQSLTDRTREIQTETAALNAGRTTGREEREIQQILDTTNREAGIQRIEGNSGRAQEIDNLGIAELQNLKAQLTKGTGTGSGDPLYNDFQGKGDGDEVKSLLQKIDDSINALNGRQQAGP